MYLCVPQEKREGEYINLELATEEREKGNTAFKEQRYPEVRGADAWSPNLEASADVCVADVGCVWLICVDLACSSLDTNFFPLLPAVHTMCLISSNVGTEADGKNKNSQEKKRAVHHEVVPEVAEVEYRTFTLTTCQEGISRFSVFFLQS